MGMSAHSIAVRINIVCVALPAAVALAGCGATDSSASGVPAPILNSAVVTQVHNQADITFVEDMLSHNSQVIAMLKLVPDHSEDLQVKGLADRIQTSQQTAVDQMNNFMQAWNSSPSPSGGSPGAVLNPGTAGGTAAPPMPAMMPPTMTDELNSAAGPAFDKPFLRIMNSYHAAAILRSEAEVRDGVNADVKALAQRIIETQQGEIVEMRSLERRIDHGGQW